MLSTSDNPYNPYYDYVKWDRWDREHGYNTVSYQGAIAAIFANSGRFTDEEVYELTVDEIMSANITGNYVIIPTPADDNDSSVDTESDDLSDLSDDE